MTERDLIIECMPQITEMTMEVQKMTTWEYLDFKREYLEEVSRTYPKVLGLVKKILDIVEWCLSM